MIGQTLAHYKITAKLGQGGMGAVYRATDTKLDREVAIKVLPESFAQDRERLARFEREAKVLASLNHPNIAAIHGLEQIGNSHALILELVEGEDLSERLKRGPLPVEEALDVCKQIAEALEAAHEKGIIHRDLKPGNVKLTGDGKVKVLDFGLAKTATADSTGIDPDSPTLTADYTLPGTLLGTAGYMSPEQARGKPVDKRSDIWSFGGVLYECLTGAKPFRGDTVTDLMAAVLLSEPDWSRLPDETPREVSTLLRRCLEKDPRRRLSGLGDIAILLDESTQANRRPAESVTTVTRAKQPVTSRHNWAWLVAAVLGAALVVAGFFLWRSHVTGKGATTTRTLAAERTATSLDLRADAPLAPAPRKGTDSPKVAISPDGRHIVYVGETKNGTALFHREIDHYEVKEIPGTQDAVYAFFSPDGHTVGFLTDDKVKKVSLNGDPPITLSDVKSAVRAVWTRNNVIYLAENAGTSLSRMSSEEVGSTAQIFNLVERYAGSYWASFSDILPDGSAALVVVWSRGMSADYADVHLLSLDTKESRPIIAHGYDAHFAGENRIVFARAGSLYSVGWDPARMTVLGEPHPIASGVRMESHFGQAQYCVSETDTLVYTPGGVKSVTTVARVDRNGLVERLDVPAQTYTAISVAPDDRRLALGVADVNDYVWIYDLERKEGHKLHNGVVPVWSHDGREIAFSMEDPLGGWQVVAQPVEGTAEPRKLCSSEGQVMASSWSVDGSIGFYQQHAGIYSIGYTNLNHATGAESSPDPGEYALFPKFSPDGHWVAYMSEKSGRMEIWVRSLLDGRKVEQISTHGGIEPVWCPNGELFYRTGNQWMVTSVATSSGLSYDPPHKVFAADFVDTPNGTWDVSPDGKYIYLFQEVSENDRTRLHIVQHLSADLNGNAPTGKE